MSYQSRQTNNRVTAAPECGPKSDILPLPAAAQDPFLEAVRAAASSQGLDEGEISGFLICPAGDCFLATATTGGAGSGIKITTGERFYMPYPGEQQLPLLYECAAEVFVWVLY